MPRTKETFVHLHNHSEFSLLDGASRISEMIKRAKSLGMPAIAITDHGNMYAAVKFYVEAKEHDIKPIIGCELYVARGSRFDKQTKEDRSPNHLTVLAKNTQGYKNLIKLVTIASLEGFYSKPRIDKEVLYKNSKGLIVLSGCPIAEIPSLLAKGDEEKARQVASELKEVFKDDFYLEIQDLGYPDQKKINENLIKLGKELGISVVASNDTHYVNKEDALSQDVMLCIQTGKILDEKERMRLETQEFYIKAPSEMKQLFSYCPEAIDNSLEIADKIDFEMEIGVPHLPHFKVPEGFTSNSYLEKLVWEGIKIKYGTKQVKSEKYLIPPEIKERVERELSIIEKMNYSAYFLIVQDFINFARSKDIQVGPGRGSAAGSIVSYALGITMVDPMQYGLLFERFLNPERVSMPDIDIDFCFERRGEVIEYVAEKYGVDHVAQIITFGTMAARGAIRDVGRVLGIPLAEVDKVAKMVPFGPKITIDSALSTQKELKELYTNKPIIKKLLDIAKSIEGVSRHASVHAAGVVISEKPLTEYVPIQSLSENQNVTQYSMEDLEKIGLLKMDFLGLRNLTMIDHTVKIIKRVRGIELDIANIPFDDLATYKLFTAGETIGVFQLESRGMRGIIKELKPNNFEEIIALLALYRPGPLESGMVDDFIKRKHKRVPVKYDLPELEPILRGTYGVILYQEQVMQIASKVAGFSLGQADILRRAMGKKKTKEMAKMREEFTNGAIKRNISKHKAVHLFNLCEKFAGYGFNKSHSTAYGVISYQTAYLKANFPVEYMAALLSSIMGNTDKLTLYINECIHMGIKILPPDVNESFRRFTVVKDGIRFGLTAVKNVGEGAIDTITKNRELEGPYKSLFNFCQRVDLRACNKRVIESLIKAGAFDSINTNRAMLLAIVEKTVEKAGKSSLNQAQETLFKIDLDSSRIEAEIMNEVSVDDFSPEQKLRLEKEMVGLYISGHPLIHIQDLIKTQVSTRIEEIGDLKEGQNIKIGGLLAGCRRITTKRGQTMMVGTIEDLTANIPIVIFPKTYESNSALLVNDAVVIIKGKVNRDMRTNEYNVLVDSVEQLSDEIKERILFVDADGVEEKEVLSKIKEVLIRHSGKEQVFIKHSSKIIKVGDNLKVNISPELIENLENVLGSHSVRIELRAAKKETLEPQLKK